MNLYGSLHTTRGRPWVYEPKKECIKMMSCSETSLQDTVHFLI